MMELVSRLSLYVIPDRKIGAPLSIPGQAEQAIEGGATAIQLRDKSMSSAELYTLAVQLVEICRKHQVLFIVNDRLDIAVASGADGIHLGQTDLPVGVIRRLVSPEFIVGVSARSVQEAIEAEKAGADYLGVGAIFPTGSKKDARVIGLDPLKEIAGSTDLPIVAIGGMDTGNIPIALNSGASGVAVISSIVGGKGIKESACNIKGIITGSGESQLQYGL